MALYQLLKRKSKKTRGRHEEEWTSVVERAREVRDLDFN